MDKHEISKEKEAKYQLHYYRKIGLPELTEKELEEESALIYSSLMKGRTMPVRSRKLWYPAAAAAVLLIAAGIYWMGYTGKISLNKEKSIEQLAGKDPQQDIAPANRTATLVLGDGRKIVLDEFADGQIAEEAGVAISKTAGGKLIYTVRNRPALKNLINKEVNTLSTVKGQQYQVVLPDGSEVWLNAASTITYPANFANLKNRVVQLTGEAYFEVAKDKNHPFIVKTSRQQVEVLGTHFNVNSYDDEKATRTTLLEGSVKVWNDKGQEVLLPGQQSAVAQGAPLVSKANVNETVAWKNGDFIFDNEEFGSILRQLSRWYNVEIVDEDRHEGLRLSGTISRSRNISTVLKALEVTGKVKFRMEGRTLTVQQ